MKKFLLSILTVMMLFNTLNIPIKAMELIELEEKEKNNSISTANELIKGCAMSGDIYGSDKDYFTFTIDKEVTVYIVGMTKYEGLLFKLIDSNNKTIDSFQTKDNDKYNHPYGMIELPLEAGTYYIYCRDVKERYITNTYLLGFDFLDEISATPTLQTNSFVYDGEVKKPEVTIKGANGKTLVSGEDYILKYDGKKGIGVHNVTIEYKGNYCGPTSLTYTIKPGVPTNLALSKRSQTYIKLKWNSVKSAEGYCVYVYDEDEEKYVYVKRADDNNVVVKDLQHSTEYKFKVRAFKTVNGKRIYGDYSSAFKISTVYKTSISISKKSYTYDGKSKKPSVTVKKANGVKVASSNYKVKYDSNTKGVGKHKVVVTGLGKYKTEKTFTYTISPSVNSSFTAYTGETFNLKAKSDKKITYSSSNKNVASVNTSGVVTAVKKGSATITVKSNGMTKKVKITVKDPTIIISGDSSIKRGNSTNLKATTTPSGVKVNWSVDNQNIATISNTGKLTAKSVGTVTITASITYKGKKYTDKYKVNVEYDTPNLSVWMGKDTRYSYYNWVFITNNGTKPLTILNRTSFSNGVSSTSDIDMMDENLRYVSSITISPGVETDVCYVFSGKRYFIIDDESSMILLVKYDGITYQVIVRADRYGLNQVYKIERVS